MDQSTLKNLRLIIPGLISLLAIFYPIKILKIYDLNNFISSIKDWNDLIPLITMPSLIGVLYYVSNIRYVFWKSELHKVQENIKDRLVDTFINDYTLQQQASLKSDKSRIMRIFYHFVDSHPSLTTQSQNVKFNGLIWTTFLDTSIITCFFGAASITISIILKIKVLMLYGWILIVVCMVSYAAFRSLTKRHLMYSNEQIDSIIQLFKAELKNKLNDIL
ncbi:hypothetical protein GCM10027037_06510 [Mucilaginibacter koreensis]